MPRLSVKSETRTPWGLLSDDEKTVIGERFNWKFGLLYT